MQQTKALLHLRPTSQSVQKWVRDGAGQSRPADAQVADTGRTAWVRNLDTPLRTFLRTETGSGAILLVATVGARVWVNVDPAS